MTKTTTTLKGELQIDHDRGVIYFHANDIDEQRCPLCVLRICSLPTPIPQVCAIGEQQERSLDITHMFGTDWTGTRHKDKGRKLELNKTLPIRNDPTFGKWVDLRSAMPDCDLVVVCYNKGTGMVPWKVLLMHQVSVADLEEIAQQSQVIEIDAIPCKSGDIVTLGKVK